MGREVTVSASLSRKRSCPSGALSEPGFDCMFYDRAGSDSFCDFLSHMYKRHERSGMWVDNASYHKSGKVREMLAGYNGRIVLKYFLPYTPELNPVEVQWRGIKKGTANTPCGGTEEMKGSIGAMLGNGEVRVVKMVDYLTL